MWVFIPFINIPKPAKGNVPAPLSPSAMSHQQEMFDGDCPDFYLPTLTAQNSLDVPAVLTGM